MFHFKIFRRKKPFARPPPFLENLFQDGTTELLWGSSNIMKVKDIASLFVYCEFHHICGQLQDKFGFGQFWQKVKIWGSLFGTTSKLWPIFFLKAQLKVCFKLPLVNPGFQHARSERPICSLLNRIAVEFTILFAGQLHRINQGHDFKFPFKLFFICCGGCFWETSYNTRL